MIAIARRAAFLHGLAFIEAGFARRTGGPDFRAGVDLDRLSESWSTMWSPMIEARLIERSADADDLESAVVAEVLRRLVALDDTGRGGDAVAAIDLFAAAAQAGIAGRVGAVLPFIDAAITRDSDLATVAAALRDLVQLWRARAMFGLGDPRAIERLIAAAWRRALFLLPGLANAGEERIAATLDALVVLREVVALARGELSAIDTTLFDEAVAALLAADLKPALAGAVAALAVLAGRMDEDELGPRLSGELAAAYADPAERVGWLRGVIAVSRELLWRAPGLIEAADAVLAGVDEDGFVALLPHLRLAFAALDPRDIDRLAHEVGARHGVGASALLPTLDITPHELEANLAADRQVRALLAADGLL